MKCNHYEELARLLLFSPLILDYASNYLLNICYVFEERRHLDPQLLYALHVYTIIDEMCCLKYHVLELLGK